MADGTGQAVPVLVEPSPLPGSVRLSFRAARRARHRLRTYRVRHQAAGRGAGGGRSGWESVPGTEIANEHLEIAADPARGGGLSRVTDRASGFQLVPEGEVGNELLVYPEYANHPRFGEGPWHLLPLGPPARSGSEAATVRAERSALGQRLVVEGALRGFGYRQVVTLWDGARRAELRTEIHGWAIQDHLLRLRFPTTLAGGTPVSAVGDAVVARGFGLIDVDSSEQPWTLDNPAAEWFGVSTTLVVEAAEAGRSYHRRSIGVAEVVTPVGAGAAPWARRLVVALVQKGVTATCSEADRNRYGGLEGDSNLPDFRVAVGGPAENPFVADVLQAAGPAYARRSGRPARPPGLGAPPGAGGPLPARGVAAGSRPSRPPGPARDRGGRDGTRPRRWRRWTPCRPRWSPGGSWWSNRPPWCLTPSRCPSGRRPCSTGAPRALPWTRRARSTSRCCAPARAGRPGSG